MMTEVQLDSLEEACKAIVMARKASQAMRAFGRIAMPDSLRADELLTGVNRSEVAIVFEFFGDMIDETAARAHELIDRVGIDADKALASTRKTAELRGAA